MENLPVEILISIFIKLHTLRKIECMSVCRLWNEVIKGHSLLETVVIRSKFNNLQRFHSLITHIKNSYSSGHCTRRLVLGDLGWTNMHIAELIALFPNLRLLILKNSTFQMQFPFTNKETISTLKKWLSQLENICEYSETPIIPILLNHYYRFNQLVLLSATSCRTIEGTEHAEWFHYLKNAPALKIFSVRNILIKLIHIKALHENAPLITTLEFIGVTFMTERNLDSRLPKPPLIEALSIKYCWGPFSSDELWALYFIKNYVHLHDFTFEYDPAYDVNLP